MEVVERFLKLRREGRGEEAYAMLAPNASLSCPWGGMRHGESVRRLLLDEPKFTRKGYLDEVPVERIDDNTFQRKFRWERGMAEQHGCPLTPWRFRQVWREVYFVRDGAIQLVTSDKMLPRRSFRTMWTLSFD